MAFKLQLKRNASLFENKEAAIEGLSTALANGKAGEIMIATYKQEDPYMYEIPLYNTDGGDTYIDWLNENKKGGINDSLLLNAGDIITMQFSGHLSVMDVFYGGEGNPLLYFGDICSAWFLHICCFNYLPVNEMTELLQVNATITADFQYGDQLLSLNARIVTEDNSSQEINEGGHYNFSSLGQLRYDGSASNVAERISSFKMAYIPNEPILKEKLYKDEFNYSDIQLG